MTDFENELLLKLLHMKEREMKEKYGKSNNESFIEIADQIQDLCILIILVKDGNFKKAQRGRNHHTQGSIPCLGIRTLTIKLPSYLHLIGREKVENVRENFKTFGGLGKLYFCPSVKVRR